MADDMTSDGMATGGHGMGMEMASMGAETLSFAGFMLAWLAMMVAMMFPAIMPVVRLYAGAAARGNVAPLPFFVAGYIAVWWAAGLPAYLAWRELMGPVADAEPWAARVAGTVLLGSAAYQLTPLKEACLRQCRSPMGFFLRQPGARLSRPVGALTAGAGHGSWCFGCCWALMAVLVALGTMNILWMLALAAVILVEKTFPWGELGARLAAAGMAVAGVWLLVSPQALEALA